MSTSTRVGGTPSARDTPRTRRGTRRRRRGTPVVGARGPTVSAVAASTSIHTAAHSLCLHSSTGTHTVRERARVRASIEHGLERRPHACTRPPDATPRSGTGAAPHAAHHRGGHPPLRPFPAAPHPARLRAVRHAPLNIGGRRRRLHPSFLPHARPSTPHTAQMFSSPPHTAPSRPAPACLLCSTPDFGLM